MSLITLKTESAFTFITLFFTILVGGITFSGSVVAWGKLSGKMSSKAVIFTGLRELSILHLIGMVVIGRVFFDSSLVFLRPYDDQSLLLGSNSTALGP